MFKNDIKIDREISKYLLWECSLFLDTYISKYNSKGYKYAIWDTNTKTPKFLFKDKDIAVDYMNILYQVVKEHREKYPDDDKIIMNGKYIYFN